ncbi:MAG TPA: PmoA family protein [Chthoniobacteraceae bacterium]
MSLLPRALAVFCTLVFTLPGWAEVTVKELPDRVRIELDGKLFTELRFSGAQHSYLWPLLGPDGAKLTRSWPMEEAPGEEHDHVHHRSVWFGHGLVNGVDFWTEDATHGTKKPKHPVGTIVHEKILTAKGGASEGVVAASQRWVAPDGAVPITSIQTVRVLQTPPEERLFDFQVQMTAGTKDVLFGDTKEGTFAMRIAESMRLKQAKNQPGKGQIVNSEGLTDAKAWGAAAKWVAMSGPIDGKPYTIAVFDHPANLRHPTRWHARDYGLFAANPFCVKEMDLSKKHPEGAGDFTLAAGKDLTLRYRVFVHTGAPNSTLINERFAQFAKDTQPLSNSPKP